MLHITNMRYRSYKEVIAMYQHDIDINDIEAAVPHDCTTCDWCARKGKRWGYEGPFEAACIWDKKEALPTRSCSQWEISMDAFCGAIEMIEKHREETLARLKKEYAKE